MKLDLLVFDLDGTLVDSMEDICTAVTLTTESFGIPPLPKKLIVQHVGIGVRPLITQALRDNGIDEAERAMTVFNKSYSDNILNQTRLYPGILDVLKHFEQKPKVVLTNKSNLFTEPLLKLLGIHHHFTKSYGRESFPVYKPDPLPLRSICQEFKAEPQNTVMIGDTDVDIKTGKGAGTFTCAALYGFGERQTILAENPDYQIEHPSELIDLFK
ncbi:MAG: HAD family hydrolase [Pseudobdellovibrionaceae bacterium]